MDIKEFRAKCYELLEKKGSKEISGRLYYPEDAILDLMEWWYDYAHTNKLTIDDIEGKVNAVLEKTLKAMRDSVPPPGTFRNPHES